MRAAVSLWTPIQRRGLHRQASPRAGCRRVAPATTRKAPQDSRFDTLRLSTHLANSPSRKSKTHIGRPGFLNKALEHRLNLSAIHPPSLRPHNPAPHTLHPLAAMSKAYWLCHYCRVTFDGQGCPQPINSSLPSRVVAHHESDSAGSTITPRSTYGASTGGTQASR